MPVACKKEPTPYWRSDCGRATIYVGDCRDVMAHLTADQFHAVVTDPPYGLEFMGKAWDAPWKNDGKIEVCNEGTHESHPFRDGTQRVCYGTDSVRYQEWFEKRADAMLSVAKPGAHLLSFGGTRMWHRMACAIEDVGWTIRDTIMWVYGSGFPKSHDVSKAIDKEGRTAPTEEPTLNSPAAVSHGHGWLPPGGRLLRPVRLCPWLHGGPPIRRSSLPSA